MLRGKFIIINTYIKKQTRSQISNLTLQPKELEKKKKKEIKPTASRRKEIHIRADEKYRIEK